MPSLPAHNLDYVLAGMAYPATYWQILAWADYNCATGKLRKALWQLPGKTYFNQRAIAAALWEQPGGAAACCPPPRIAIPPHRNTRGRHGHSRTPNGIRRIA
jgi:hypothetical protein